MFNLDSYDYPYDADSHSHCISFLKDYGDYYQISVCKMINNGEKETLSDEILSYIAEGLSKSEAKSLAFYLRTGTFLDWGLRDSPINERALETEHMGRYVNNIIRAKSTLKQLGACNEWDYFVTFTIDGAKYDRYDFQSFYKAFSKFKNNYVRDYGCKFKYVFVPEQHEDGAWHLHGLIGDLPESHLNEFQLQNYFPFTEQRLPKYIREKLMKGHKMYEWPAFRNKFGWTVVEPLIDKSKASSYITKYIGKGFSKSDVHKGMRLILPSLGLQRAETIKKGFVCIRNIEPSFDNEYATVFRFDKDKYNVDQLLSYFK